jgi:hypothetical protein
MREVGARAASFVTRHEMVLVLALTVLTFCSIPLWHGGLGIGWDGLNHHFYLGWIADKPRFDKDFLAAASQSVQFPYLYWPLYRLAAAGASGAVAGMVLAALQATLALPLLLLARACIPGRTLFDLAMRSIAMVLALATSAILLLINTTGNDVMAAIPMLWAMALAIAVRDGARPAWLTDARAIFLSGVLAGVAVGCKLSNGPIALLLPGLWLLAGANWKQRAAHVARGCVGVALGVVLSYGYWALQLWQVYGNPVYPMFDPWFGQLRALVGWRP